MKKISSCFRTDFFSALEKQGFGAFSVVNHIIDHAGMFRLYRLSRMISASRIRFIVDFVRQQSDYYYDSMEEE